MKTGSYTHWAAAFGAALGLHLACASAYVGWAPRRVPPAGAFDQGTGGVEIGVGRVGSYADLAELRDAPDEPDETARQVAPKVRAAEAETVTARAPDRNVSRVESAAPDPVVLATPTPLAVPVAVPEPVHPSLAEPPSGPPPAVRAEPAEPERPDPVPQPDAPSDASSPPAEAKRAEPPHAGRTVAARRADGARHVRRRGGQAGDPQHYFSRLVAWLNRYKDYPPEVKKRKQQGTVVLAFSINRAGEATPSATATSSAGTKPAATCSWTGCATRA